MYTQAEVNTKITALKTYSVAQDPATADLFTPLETSVQEYFAANANISGPLRNVVKYMYNDIARRTTVYETDWSDNLPTNYPAGYNDVRTCLYDFAELMTVDNATFFAAFVYETPTATAGSTAEPVPVSNDYLTEWAADITTATTGDSTLRCRTSPSSKTVTRRQFAWRCSMRSAANWTVSRANCWCGNRTTRQKRNNHP